MAVTIQIFVTALIINFGWKVYLNILDKSYYNVLVENACGTYWNNDNNIKLNSTKLEILAFILFLLILNLLTTFLNLKMSKINKIRYVVLKQQCDYCNKYTIFVFWVSRNFIYPHMVILFEKNMVVSTIQDN